MKTADLFKLKNLARQAGKPALCTQSAEERNHKNKAAGNAFARLWTTIKFLSISVDSLDLHFCSWIATNFFLTEKMSSIHA